MSEIVLTQRTAATNLTHRFDIGPDGRPRPLRRQITIGHPDERQLGPTAFAHVADESGNTCADCGLDLFPGATAAQRAATPGWPSGHPILLLFHPDGSWAHSIDLATVAACVQGARA